MNTELVVINKTLPDININFDVVELELNNLLSTYTGFIVTEENIEQSKEVQKRLAGLSRDINQRKIDIKKEMSVPIVAFETRCKDLIGLVDKVNEPIKQGLLVFEEKRKEDKRQLIQGYIDSVIVKYALFPRYGNQITIDERYLNVTAKMKDIETAIDLKAETLKLAQDADINTRAALVKYISEISAEQDLVLPLEVKDFDYIFSRDEINLMAAMSEIKNNAVARKTAELKAVEKAVEKVVERQSTAQAEAQQQIESQQAAKKVIDRENVLKAIGVVPVAKCKIVVSATEKQLELLKSFINQNGIELIRIEFDRV
jgi:hypothetical protein